MNESKEQGALAVQPVLFEENAENGNKPMIATATMPIAKFVSNEQLIAEEKFLASKESEIERRYAGTRGWLRVAKFPLFSESWRFIFIWTSLKFTKSSRSVTLANERNEQSG